MALAQAEGEEESDLIILIGLQSSKKFDTMLQQGAIVEEEEEKEFITSGNWGGKLIRCRVAPSIRNSGTFQRALQARGYPSYPEVRHRPSS